MTPQHISRINDVLYYIHKDIARELPARELADVAAYSEHHFHRVFKDVVGEPIHQYIRRTRMEYAANQLMFEPSSSVLDIANKCGFSSVSSFSRAFKSTFRVSPGEWRKHDLQTAEKPYLTDPEVAAGYLRVTACPLPEPKILDIPERFVAYIRHTGYNRSIKNTWRVLSAWAKHEGRDVSMQFGLHHSNPAWVALEQCRYVACIEISKPIKVRGVVNQLVIPGGLHAVFHLTGVYGELLPQISKILEQWLPQSGFKLGATPAYVHYQNNHFLNDNERFELDFYLPIGFF
ncbi:AraC family transcriptional regulator [Enterovibrio sp. ZSDZ35]|uniref:AraC family transcriptional regulator n=1 Tax=Enterovibrio qingdaonensis TaxID=2899818 RepID=A0ABT5QEZ7_9GAMM|nr:AraC family transcriptional regulator [Enterovibrio sp. ZSDZ35]MDD1779562.1 AraC family transcriptional regulator [Enterovibrio sp. ZSDZ35]